MFTFWVSQSFPLCPASAFKYNQHKIRACWSQNLCNSHHITLLGLIFVFWSKQTWQLRLQIFVSVTINSSKHTLQKHKWLPYTRNNPLSWNNKIHIRLIIHDKPKAIYGYFMQKLYICIYAIRCIIWTCLCCAPGTKYSHKQLISRY